MATTGRGETASFDTLLAMNAVGIVEKIFLLLDRVSLEKCRHVCKAWSNVLSSEVFLRKKASLSKRMWLNAENLDHQVWARLDHDRDQWTAKGDEVAYFSDGLEYHPRPMGTCTYFNSDGVRKTCQYGSWGRGDLWILKKTILIVDEDSFHFINKVSMVSSSLKIPKEDQYSHNVPAPFTHFNPATGLSIVTLPIKAANKPSSFIWVGHISINHRQESKWTSDFNEDFITDEDGCSFFARVDIGNLTIASYSFSYNCFKTDFSEDGSRFILRSPQDVMDPNQRLNIFALERENSRLLWSTEIALLSEFVHVNSRFVFMLNNGVIKVLNISDGSVVKTIELHSNDGAYFWWRTIRSTDNFLLAFLPSPPPHFEWKYDDRELSGEQGHGEKALDPDLIMIKQDTYELKRQLIRESQEETLLVPSLPPSEGPGGFGFLEEKTIGVVPKCFREGGVNKIKICHLDLEANKVFNGRSVTKSRVPFGGDVHNIGQLYEQPDPYEEISENDRFRIDELTGDDGMKWIKDFHEICTGVYIIEYFVTATVDGGGETRVHFLEIVSWKSEELPKALKEFLNARFQSI